MIFGSADWPLRPSKLGKLVKCPMSVYLDGFFDDSGGGKGAQTGSLCHKAIEMFHRTLGDPITKQEAALAELLAQQANFPLGDTEKARKWTFAYTRDPKNEETPLYLETPVTLHLDPDIVISGTLDQVRHDLRVWDIKSGASLKPHEAVAEYQYQQACYVLAARQTLKLDIHPGGLIMLAGYDQPRGTVFVEMGLTLDDCWALMEVVKQKVLDVRAGARHFQPSNGACQYCNYKPFPACREKVADVDKHR